MAPPPSLKIYKNFPEHLLHYIILPRLPFKRLSRLKCISKNTYSVISTDAQFAIDQSCSADNSSSGFVYKTDSGLSFFPDPTLIGVPDPSLNFLNPTSLAEIKLVTSTNGLFLLYGEFNGKTSLCVCNPAMKDMAFVPYVIEDKHFFCEMGLAYDPSELPDRYTIVDPLMKYYIDGSNRSILYKFKVFCSDTGKWIHSRQKVYIGPIVFAVKAVCAKGVIYWPCGKIILWYDTKRDLAGSVTLPVVEGNIIKETNVGVYAGEIIFSRVWNGGIEVWRLNGGSYWDRLHAASWDDMVDAFDFCHGMRLRHKSLSDMFFERRLICPVGFDGRFVYIAVRLKYGDNTQRLFGWETETGRVEEKGLITLNEQWPADRVFKYANSMARVPQKLDMTTTLGN